MPKRLLLAAITGLTLLVAPGSAGAASYVPGQVIVKYRAGTPESVRARLESLAGTDTRRKLAGGSEQVAIEDGASVRATAATLNQDPNVDYAVPNFKAQAAEIPNDPSLRRQWNFLGTYGIGMEEAW